MSKKNALWFLFLASPVTLVTSFSDTAFGEVLFTVVAVAFPVALMALGSAPREPLPSLRWGLFGLLVFYEACFAAMLLLRGHLDAPEGPGPWILGLPLAAAIEIYGVFLLPLLAVAWLHAATFERLGPSPKELENLRRRFRAEGGDG